MQDGLGCQDELVRAHLVRADFLLARDVGAVLADRKDHLAKDPGHPRLISDATSATVAPRQIREGTPVPDEDATRAALDVEQVLSSTFRNSICLAVTS